MKDVECPLLHLPELYRPDGADRHTIPAEVCGACSDFEAGLLVPASFCEQARAVMNERNP